VRMKIATRVHVHESYRAAAFDEFSSLTSGSVLALHLPVAIMIVDAFDSCDGLLSTAAAILDVVGMQSRIELDILKLEHGSARNDVQFRTCDIA